MVGAVLYVLVGIGVVLTAALGDPPIALIVLQVVGGLALVALGVSLAATLRWRRVTRSPAEAQQAIESSTTHG
ncbi:MAG: hypothetical protein ACR2HP_06095 [Ilumatobacteraceae bacterium]